MRIGIWPEGSWFDLDENQENYCQGDDYAIVELPDHWDEDDIDAFTQDYVRWPA